ncbi:MAG: TetM/TetW/TetO/TetS family tetracycline resistance ribosomal protection protein [Coriobacteriia bacterium]|nr:TetM/TetW/TetO/TetS family tetracycline resistance ribosomal protection protein [Coriobacteriia bacterium]
MKQLVLGVLAHVDAGKTTLSEALLYATGQIRALGRVDHGDAFLDTDAMERQRGITIFCKQARFATEHLQVTLVDTPGHVDFAGGAERALQVLDYAVLVVSGPDGVQGHTRTLWRLLRRAGVPTFVFVNKMDLEGADRGAVLRQLNRKLGEGFVDFGAPGDDAFFEAASLQDEAALEEFLETGALADATLARLVSEGLLFPCYFGSALKLQGVDELLAGLESLALEPKRGERFGALVHKITHDDRGERLTWLKVTGGSLRPKDVVRQPADQVLEGEEPWEQKVNQVRLYSGERFEPLDRAVPGQLVAVTGLSRTYAGQGLGEQPGAPRPLLEPVLACKLELPEGADVHRALEQMRLLEDEDPLLRVWWSEQLQEIRLQLMGQIQQEVIRQVIADRFGLEVDFGPGGILYKETVSAPVEGVGHFEPLRHYAEVHLFIEPLSRGAGMEHGSVCSEDFLDRNWQRLITQHLIEREHVGVLVGAPLTDVRLVIATGRAHAKHTNGGDFRQATYRAIRQGLMQARANGTAVLLEPWYDYELEVPQDQVGRALSDLQQRSGSFDAPQVEDGFAVLRGRVPVKTMQGYALELNAYSHGKGRLTCVPAGYFPCHDQEAAVAEAGYDPCSDLQNPPHSVFCDHGAGFTVPWDQVPEHMHLPFAGVDVVADAGVRTGE